MNLLKILKYVSYSIPLVGLIYIVWGSQLLVIDTKSTISSDVPSVIAIGAEPIKPLPLYIDLNPNIVALGKSLFNDTVMSDNNVACVTCHNLTMAGTDGLDVSIDIRGGKDRMNTPTVFNVSLNPLLTWFGISMTLEQQIETVLANPKHMDGNWENIIDRIKQNANYKDRFEKVFGDGVNRNNIKKAIADYERSLITPNADFDNYLRGDESAVSKDQKKGYGLFKQYGCIACHQGMNIGGNIHAKLGTFISPFINTKADIPQSEYNLGLYNITGEESDNYVFRVPSLRNVAKTSPYFHTGHIDNLEEAVKFMAKYQIGREMPDADAVLIAEFLRALTGEYEGRTL